MTDRLGWMGHDGRLELGAMCERGRLEEGRKSLGGPQQGSGKTLSIIVSYFIRLVALALCEYAERKRDGEPGENSICSALPHQHDTHSLRTFSHANVLTTL